MKSWYQKKEWRQSIRGEEVYNTDPEVEEFFGQLQLLTHIPPMYLLPDGRVLEEEKLCFFYLDPEWISCLFQGALSIGSAGLLEGHLDEVAHRRLTHTSHRRSGEIRSRRLGISRTAEDGETVRSGFLLRSEAVRCWPGIEARCWSAIDEKGEEHPLLILRMERIANDTVICIVSGEIGRIELAQPSEGIYFEVLKDMARFREKRTGQYSCEGVLDIHAITANSSEGAWTPVSLAERLLHRQKLYQFKPNRDHEA